MGFFNSFKKEEVTLNISLVEFNKVKQTITELQKENNLLKSSSKYRDLENEIKDLKAEVIFREQENSVLSLESTKKDIEITKLRSTLSAVLEKLNKALGYVEESERRQTMNKMASININASDFIKGSNFGMYV